MEEQYISKAIQFALNQLNSTFEQNPEKTKEIAAQFIEETPALLATLREEIKVDRCMEAAALIHKVKSRYGYFGLDEITEELNTWEKTLRSNNAIESSSLKLDRIDKITTQMIAELKKSNGENLPHGKPIQSLLSKKCVLIAEDDDVNAMVMELFVTELGAEAIRAHDGFEAISKTVEKKPDLILMDVHMPYCSGLEAIKGIRSRGIKTAIISLSASSYLNERDESLQAGGDDFLMKPANRNAIEQMLTKHLGKLTA